MMQFLDLDGWRGWMAVMLIWNAALSIAVVLLSARLRNVVRQLLSLQDYFITLQAQTIERNERVLRMSSTMLDSRFQK